jgi:hypothetical protein
MALGRASGQEGGDRRPRKENRDSEVPYEKKEKAVFVVSTANMKTDWWRGGLLMD